MSGLFGSFNVPSLVKQQKKVMDYHLLTGVCWSVMSWQFWNSVFNKLSSWWAVKKLRENLWKVNGVSWKRLKCWTELKCLWQIFCFIFLLHSTASTTGKSLSLDVNNKMSSYQASVEFDLNQSSSDDSSETVQVIVEYDPESGILAESNVFDSKPEGLYWISHWQTTIGSKSTAEKCMRPSRGTRCYRIDFIVSKVWILGKQLVRIYLSATYKGFSWSTSCLESITDNFSWDKCFYTFIQV